MPCTPPVLLLHMAFKDFYLNKNKLKGVTGLTFCLYFKLNRC